METKLLRQSITVLLSALFIIFTVPLSRAGEISKELQEELAAAKPGTILTVIIKIQDKKSPPKRVAALAAPRSEVQEFLVDQMIESQKEILAEIRKSGKKPRGIAPQSDLKKQEFIIPLWINNSIVAKLTAEEVKALAARADVVTIYPDRTYRLPLLPGGQSLQRVNNIAETQDQKVQYTYGLAQIGIPALRNKYGLWGDEVRVGHMDSGVDGEHPALKGKVIKFNDLIDGKTEPYDDHGHGTHTAGTIAGSSSSLQFGVAPNVKLIAVKVFASNGFTKTSILLQAMQWLADPDGKPETDDAPQVINNSWGGPAEDRQKETPFWEAVDNWVKLGIFPVFAAGNEGRKGLGTVGTPAAFPQSLAIAANDAKDQIAEYSSRGPARPDYCVAPQCLKNPKPDLSAPGSDVFSTRPRDEQGQAKYGLDSGTSMAAPHVSGLIALMLQYRPDLTVSKIRELLTETADYKVPPGAEESTDLQGRRHNLFFGYGRVNGAEVFAELEKLPAVKRPAP